MTVIIMAIIYTCLLIRKVTYRYFLIFAVLQNMIHMDSCTLFFRMKSFLPDYTVSKVLLDSAHDAMLEFCWHDHSRFREIIICIRFIFSPFKHRHSFYRSSGMSRSFFAAVLASARRFTSSLSRMWLTWVFTVGSFTSMICAISALLLSAQIKRSICNSVGVSFFATLMRGARKRG